MVHTHTETLGDIIKKARQESGITMEELAFRLDVTISPNIFFIIPLY